MFYACWDSEGNEARWAGHATGMGGSRSAYRYRVFMGKPPLGRPKRKVGDNIKINISIIGYEDGRWLEIGRDCARIPRH